MERPDARGPNSEQIRYWNDDAGSKWVELQERLDAQLESLVRRAMDRAAIARDERALDVGCGCGERSGISGRCGCDRLPWRGRGRHPRR